MVVQSLLLLGMGLAFTAVGAPRNDWSVVAKLSPGTRVEAFSKDSRQSVVKGSVVRASAESLVVNGKAGEVLLDRATIRVLKTAAAQRRVRSGLIGVGAGAAAGLAVGTAVCLYCRNEGHSGFQHIGLAIGAALGAIAFLPMPYQTIYRAPKK
jgi:uncharacterized SAM-binding protein YcdF (DUF218 family)